MPELERSINSGGVWLQIKKESFKLIQMRPVAHFAKRQLSTQVHTSFQIRPFLCPRDLQLRQLTFWCQERWRCALG